MSGSQATVKPSKDFWFDDGSVVVIVEDVAFRVHKSILSHYSDVFADLFTIPQPERDKDSDQWIDDCPSVQLTDSSLDFTDVLKVLYQPFYFDSLSADADLSQVISFLSGILRVSTKYGIALLRNKCISVLRTKFPSTLHGCDYLLHSGYKYDASTVVRAIPLARETNVPEILPWAFYISTNIATEALLNDPVLSWRDKALVLAGKDLLWEMQKNFTHGFFFDFPKTPCVSQCQTRSPAMDWRRMEELREHPHPLNEFSEWGSFKLCAKCLELVQMQHQKGRERVWKELPGIFQLGSWEDIAREQGR